jgi:O-antigen/teichoic acid export membrane protein
VTAPVANSDLTGGRLLACNAVWNLAGQILPMIVGLITIPAIIRAMGVERFGVLSLAWVVVGYFSLFDLGIGRALTKLVADKLGSNQEHSIAPLAWTSLLLMLGLGVFGAVVTLSIAPLMVHRLLKIPQALQNETLRGFYLLALSIPIVTITAGLRGILEALQRFRIVNLIRLPMSVFSFAGPLLVFPFSRRLVPVIAMLVIGRLVACGAYIWACFWTTPVLQNGRSFDTSFVMPLIRFGGWMTVNNIVGPLMFYLDRFLVGALLSVSAVAYYTTPVDMMLRLTLIPNAVVGVLFPAFVLSLSQDRERTGVLLSRASKYIFLIVFPIVLVTVTFAPEGLTLWLGPTFSLQGTAVLRWTAAGVFVNSLAILPFVLIQSAGRPDLTAWMLVFELPVYGVTLWFLTQRLAVEGTAIAWTGRITVEAVILFVISRRILPQSSTYLLRVSGAIVCGLMLLCLACIPHDLRTKLGCLCLALLTFGPLIWHWALTPKERHFVTGRGLKQQFEIPRSSAS